MTVEEAAKSYHKEISLSEAYIWSRCGKSTKNRFKRLIKDAAKVYKETNSLEEVAKWHYMFLYNETGDINPRPIWDELDGESDINRMRISHAFNCAWWASKVS